MPEPLFFDTSLNTAFQEALSGLHAVDIVATADIENQAAEIGRMLAGLHQSQLSGLRRWLPEDDLANVQEAREILHDYDPGKGRRAASILEKLKGSVPANGLPQTPCHGAFRYSQLLMVDGRVALLDFDGFLLGNPIHDVGSFVAHLYYLCVKEELPLDRSRNAVDSFCRSYGEAAPWGLPDVPLRWYTAASLVGKHAKKCVKRGKKQREDKIDQLLTFTEQLLADGEVLG